jgi:predicted pore-forming effector associated with SMODS systems
MTRPVPVYQPPTTPAMIDGQNDPRALRLLLAQRKLYSRAKRWSFLRWIGFSVIGVVAPILTVVVPNAAVVVGAVAGVWIFLSRTWFSSVEQGLAAKAADIQEQFDQLVFDMPAQVSRVPSASMEEIALLAGDEKAAMADADKERLRDWYPFDARVDGAISVAIAQRANAAYSERLLSANANVWLATTLVWSVAAVIVSLIVGLSLPQFLLGVALPLLPALLDVWEQFRSTKRAGEVRRTMADDIEQAVRGRSDRKLASEDLLVWQEQMYELRRRSPQVPNLVYKRARDRNEHAMNATAAELAAVALDRSGSNGTQAGEH